MGIMEPPQVEAPCIKVVEAGKFLNMEFPPRSNLLDPWLPCQGLAMVYAPRGVGKTHFSLNVAVAVATGGAFLGWEAPQPRGVLFLDGEMPANELQARLKQIVDDDERLGSLPLRIVNPDLQDARMIDISLIEDQETLEPYLEDVSLIIVDNISTLCRTGKESEGESWSAVQDWALAQRAEGRSVLFVHHAGKSGEQRGTSRREDVLDTVVSLKRPGDYTPDQGACFEVHFEKARRMHGEAVNPFEAKLDIIDECQKWTIRNLELSTAEKVADLLNQGLPQHEIAEELDLTKGSVSKAKKRAKDLGLIKRQN